MIGVFRFAVSSYTLPLMIGFFMLFGYLQAGWQGAVAGLLLYCIAVTTILVSVVPFVGVFAWFFSFSFLAGNLGAYIVISDLIFVVNRVVGVLSSLICVCTSALTVAAIIFYLRSRRGKAVLECTQADVVDVLVSRVPVTVLGSLDFSDIEGLLKQIYDSVLKLWQSLNHELVGSAAIFFGLGVASHDFHWEASLYHSDEIDVRRVSHGAYTGLAAVIAGLHMLTSELSFKDQLRKNLFGYVGVLVSAIGFFTLAFIPKGVGRVVNHAVWWCGVALIVYCWVNLVRLEFLALGSSGGVEGFE